MTKKRPVRKTPTHWPIHETAHRPAIVFLTVCTQQHKPVLARTKAHSLLANVWRNAEKWAVGRYVIMPDHIHLFCAPAEDDSPDLQCWVQYWKSMASRQWPWPEEQPIWQKSFWDTQLRSCERYEDKWEYVRDNPVRKGIVSRFDEWPYQGELSKLDWDA